MTAIYIILGILAALFLLMLISVHLFVEYEEKFKLTLKILFFQKILLPASPKKEKKPSVKKQKQKQPAPKSNVIKNMFKRDGIPAVLGLFTDIIRMGAGSAKRLLSHTRLDDLSLEIVVVEEDAAETAIKFGETCAAVYSSYALLCNLMKVRLKEISVIPGFECPKTRVVFLVTVKVKIIFIILAIIGFLLKLLANTISNQMKQKRLKGGKTYERAPN